MSGNEDLGLDADTDLSGLLSVASGQEDVTIVGAIDGATRPSTDPSDSRSLGSHPQVPGYEVMRELGQGGMGVVYLARDTALDRCAALKTFKATDAEQTRLLTSEARISGKLNHAAIVPIFEVNASCSTPFFAMAYIEGEDLARRIARQVYAPNEAAELGVQVADAIAHAHEEGVLHLDLKPANILLDRHGNPKVTDFGLFAFVSDEKTCNSGVLGTPQFMSPEQALEDHENIGVASDVYSIGAVLYAAITGRPPLVGSSPMELISKVASQRPRHLQTLVAKIPTALDAIVMKCLEKAPEKRYETAAELKRDLEAFLSGKTILAKPSGLLSKIRYQLEHHVLAASVSGSLALLLLLFTAVSLVAQAVKNHFDVARLEEEVSQIEQLYSRMHSSYLQAVSASDQELEIDRNVIQHSSDVAKMMAQSGQRQRAAMFAADAVLIGKVHGQVYDPELETIIRSYNPQWAESDLPILEMANIIERETHYTMHPDGLEAQQNAGVDDQAKFGVPGDSAKKPDNSASQ